MANLKKTLIAGLAAGAFALAGCGPVQSGEAAKKPDVWALMRSNATASLQTAAAKSEQVKSFSVKLDGAIAGKTVSGDGKVQVGSPMKADLVMNMLGQSISVRMLDTVEYVQLPAAQRSQLGGKSWMKFDLAEAAKLAGMNADQFSDQMRNIDPSKQVKAMLANGKLTVVGEDTVDGVKTVHYASNLTLAQYVDAYADPNGRAALKKQLTDAGMNDQIKTDLWVDDQYRMRKAHIAMGTKLDMTYTYADYGKPVDVVAPPAGETIDLMESLKGLKNPKG